MKHILEIVLNFNMRSFMKFFDCMHTKHIFSQAKLQVGRPKFHHNSNLDLHHMNRLLYYHLLKVTNMPLWVRIPLNRGAGGAVMIKNVSRKFSWALLGCLESCGYFCLWTGDG